MELKIRSILASKDDSKTHTSNKSGKGVDSLSVDPLLTHWYVEDTTYVDACSIREGAFFSKVFQKGLHVCALQRLEYVQHSIRKSGDVINHALEQVLECDNVVYMKPNRYHLV